MTSKQLLALFVSFQVFLFYLGVKINPLIMIAIPLAIILLVYMINNPGFSLILLSMTAIVKGFLLESIPILEFFDITVILTIILWISLLVRFLNGQINIQPEYIKPIKYFSLLAAMLAFSFLYTLSPIYGFEKILRFVIFAYTMFLTPLLIIETEKDIEKILFYFKIMVFLVTTLLIGQMIYLSLTGGFYTYLLRVTVLSANPIQVSRYLALGATMLMVMLIRRSPKEGLPYLILLLCILLGIVLTGSRGPLVSLFFGIIVYALLFERKNLSTLYFYGFIALITVVILMFILPESVTKRFFDMTEGAIILTQKGIARVSTIATRLSFWDLALTSWTAKLSTFLFGLGAGGFSHLFIWRDWHWYPHNVFIEIISELGIIGLSVFLFFLYSSYKSISKGIFNGSFSERSSIWVAGALVMFFAAQFSGDINDNRILWMMIGLSISSATIDYKNNVAKIENSF